MMVGPVEGAIYLQIADLDLHPQAAAEVFIASEEPSAETFIALSQPFQ